VTEPRRVEFQLLGHALTIRTVESPEYIHTLARYVDERVSALKSSGVRDPITALELAALDIADELFKARDDSARDQGDVGRRLGALVAMLEQATPGEPA